MIERCCGERTAASEEERRRAAASGRPPPPRDDGTLWSFATGNSLLSGLHSHLFGESSGSTCLGTRAPAPESSVEKASETGRPPPAPIQAPKFPSPSDDDLAGKSPISSSSAPGNSQPKQVTCRACGETCESRHRFCPFCGAPIASSQSVTKSGMPPKARSHVISRRATDEDLANLVPSSDEDDFARPSPEIARLRPEPSAMSPESQSSRAPKELPSNFRQRPKSGVVDEVEDDVLANYYRLRGIEPSQKKTVKASPAPTTAMPQLDERPSPSTNGKLVSREPDPQHLTIASPSPSEQSSRTGKLAISKCPDPLWSPLASPNPSERSARTAEFGAGGYSRESAESRQAPPIVFEDGKQYIRSPPAPSRQEAPPVPKPIANSQAKSVQWSWPTWALDSKQPCIEVYVEDDETGEGRWIKQCTPLHRVVHPDGHDQFLAAEYLWDDETYEQDFEPHHVRPFWSKQTVLDMARDGVLESMHRPVH